MRCKHLVERNYKWCRCSREATMLVTLSVEAKDVRTMCTQHANLEVQRSAHWPIPITAAPL